MVADSRDQAETIWWIIRFSVAGSRATAGSTRLDAVPMMVVSGVRRLCPRDWPRLAAPAAALRTGKVSSADGAR